MESRDHLRTECSDIIKNFLKKNPVKSKTEITLDDYISNTKTFIKNHPDVYILNADKGNVTVLMSKDDYHAKNDRDVERQQHI